MSYTGKDNTLVHYNKVDIDSIECALHGTDNDAVVQSDSRHTRPFEKFAILLLQQLAPDSNSSLVTGTATNAGYCSSSTSMACDERRSSEQGTRLLRGGKGSSQQTDETWPKEGDRGTVVFPPSITFDGRFFGRSSQGSCRGVRTVILRP